jgi:hypothetical protein
MDVKGMAKVIAVAALGMVVWTTFKVIFVHDPKNFDEMSARPHAIAWQIDNCKQHRCDSGGGADGTPWKAVFETDEGWIYVIATQGEPGHVALLVPRDKPRNKHLVEVSSR